MSEKAGKISLKHIIDAISVVITGSEMLLNDPHIDLIDVMNMTFENPKVVKTVDAGVNLFIDNNREWCVTQIIQRIAKVNNGVSPDIESFLIGLHHIVEGFVKDNYCRYSVSDSEDCGELRIIKPSVIGFPKEIYSMNVPGLQAYILDNRDRFQPIHMGDATFEFINIVKPRFIHDFVTLTQGFLNVNNLALRQWMNDFVDRKKTAIIGGMRPIYGFNDTFWEPCSHPARLSSLLSQFPNFNILSVVYCSEFIFPECNLTDLDVTQISATIASNSNRSEPFSTFISSTPNAANQADFKRILTALVLPQQVQVVIEFDRKKNVVLNGVIGLMSKMIFSTTPFFRNITLESARSVDAIIGSMLVSLGYSHAEGAPPLTVTGRANSAVWELIATNVESGDGWINHASDGAYHIGTPLYDNIAELPCYARQSIERNLEVINVADELVAPHIYVVINQCLQNVYSFGGEARKISSLIRYFREQY